MNYAEKFCSTCGRLLRDCTCPIIINWADVSENDKLIAENEKLKEDRDLWKASEASCNRQYNELLDENEKLKTLLQEATEFEEMEHDYCHSPSAMTWRQKVEKALEDNDE